MNIDTELCGMYMCEKCLPYCPVGCITLGESSAEIDQEECVECGMCLRDAPCPPKAFSQDFLTMPRAVRKAFSDPFSKHENTELKHSGRGTEEIKTNDVTGIVSDLNVVAIAIEMGRPQVGARFSDVEKITKALSRFDIEYEKHNPVTPYIIDKKTGTVEPQILNEKVLSCIVEFRAAVKDVEGILAALKTVGNEVKTVFSVCMIARIGKDNKTVVEDLLVKNGYPIYQASSKTNVGLGRPRYEDRVKGHAA
jgi:NAD-dependent dihydropyrimidine dehydrogenase PreA subunit